MLNDKIITQIVKDALEEDIATGDITTNAILSPKNDTITTARFLFKQDGILAGLPLVEKVFSLLDEHFQLKTFSKEGDYIPKGTVVAIIHAKKSVLLKGERTALNFMQHLSGVATRTHEYVEAIQGYPVTILDTRKTTPNLRHIEKYAVRVGGGQNYRWGLYDMVMIKDNHIKAAGSIANAINCILENYGNKYFITVEVARLEELEEAIKYPINRIMLDNMDTETIKKAVSLIAGKKEVEVSGGITPERARELAPLGIQYISTGAITNRAVSLDISMKFVNE